MNKGEGRLCRITERRKFKDHMAISPALSHIYSLKQSSVISSYVCAVKFLSAIQYIEVRSVIIQLSLVLFSAIAHKSLLEFTQSFVRTVKQGTLLRLIKNSRRYNAAVLTEPTASTTK